MWRKGLHLAKSSTLSGHLQLIGPFGGGQGSLSRDSET